MKKPCINKLMKLMPKVEGVIFVCFVLNELAYWSDNSIAEMMNSMVVLSVAGCNVTQHKDNI